MTRLAVLYNIDATLGLPVPRRQLVHVTGLLRRSAVDRRSPWAMPLVLQQLARQLPQAPLYYLSSVPDRLAGPLQVRLRRDGYPDGVLLTSGGLSSPRWVWSTDPSGKRQAVQTLMCSAEPDLRWVLIGDDVTGDPHLYDTIAAAHPGRVAVIALRQVAGSAGSGGHASTGGGRPPTVRAPAGSELLAQLRAVLGLSRAGGDTTQRWLLTGPERGNDDTNLRAHTTDNACGR